MGHGLPPSAAPGRCASPAGSATAIRGDSRTWTLAGPAPGRSRAPSPRPRRPVPPGRKNPRSCGRRRAGRWPQPRAGERPHLSNTPSKVTRSAVPAGALPGARLSTSKSCFLWKKTVDDRPGNPREVFLPHNRWIAFSLLARTSLASGRPLPQVCPQAAHNAVGVSAHLIHTVVHRVSWCRARRAAKMSEPSARTVSGNGSSAFAPCSLAGEQCPSTGEEGAG
jgi:hypothetical protein